MKKRIIALILSLVMISSMSIAPVYADNSKDIKVTLTVEEEAQIISFLRSNGVDKKTIDKLIEKYKKGILWDSLTQKYKNIKPSTVTNDNGTIIEKYVYPDGSVTVAVIEVPPIEAEENDDGTLGTRAVGGGTWESGSGYRSCFGAKVYFNSGVVNANFYADFTLVDGAYDYITDAYDYSISTITGGISDDTLDIVRSTETATKKAEAKLKWTYTAYGGAAGSVCWIKLSVGKDSYTSSRN